MSTPAAVRTGAVPPGQLTPANQVTVADPPLVSSIAKDISVPVAGVFDNVNVVVPEIVF
jgi:hypothetical protein